MTPVESQLDWVVGQLNGSALASPAGLARHFTPSFLKTVPASTLLAVVESVRASRPLRVAAVLSRDDESGLVVRLESSDAATFRLSIAVTLTAPHLIEGLVIAPQAAELGSWPQINTALAGLGERASLYAGSAGGTSIHGYRAEMPGAIGSAFKLYVLGALARAVELGRAGWNQQLAIHTAWKSLPSGTMQDEPAGASFSLRRYAEQMISISDNTAADHLIHFLGRPAVESELTAFGNHSVARDEPFLTTREAFALKLVATPTLRAAFAAAGTARRRQLLASIDRLDLAAAGLTAWTSPLLIDRIEWFASPSDLAHAIARLVHEASRPGLEPLRAILSINPGVEFDKKTWPYVGFKGGSEPGVLSLTWYLQRRDGHAFVLSIVVNDSRHGIDENAAVSIAESAIALLAVS